MTLSFCIPTYNRSQFLKKNIGIIINQIHELSVENEVEILVSDNASQDETEDLCKKYIDANPDIHIEYHKNATNEGPDWNFIKAMRLAHGEYSILFGDDDFLKSDSLKIILQMISDGDVDLILTNRTSIDSNANIISEDVFIDINTPSKIYTFKDEDIVRSYFYGIQSLGGLLTFISSVIYKTQIIEKWPLNQNVIGSNYSFLYFWWKSLLNGAKLKYYNSSLVFATTVGVTNNNYGKRIERVVVDYRGLLNIANSVFDNNNSFKRYFLKAIDADHSDISIQSLYRLSPKQFNKKLSPYLLETCWTQSRINELKHSASLFFFFCVVYNRMLPDTFKEMVRSIRKGLK